MAKFETVISLATIGDPGDGLVTEIRLVEATDTGTLLIDVRKKRITAKGDVYTNKGIVFPIDHLTEVKAAINVAVEALEILEVKG
jgi:hypothetical protein